MDAIMKADIFFFVATISMVVLTVAMVIITYYVARTVREMHFIARRIHKDIETFDTSFGALTHKVVTDVRFAVRAMGILTSVLLRPSVDQKKK